MTQEEFTNKSTFINVMIQVDKMLKKGIITKDEYLSINKKLAQKYGLSLSSIFLEIDLIE